MPALNVQFLSLLHDDFLNFDTFVETGTLDGDTIFTLEPYFDKLYTVEFSERHYNKTRSKYYGNKITFIHGDSSIVFTTLLPELTNKCIFFLDGHWSSGDTGRSAKDCPLIEEITNINNLFQNNAIIIVDDCRLFGKGPADGYNEDWSQINKDKILSILKSRTTDVYNLDSACGKDDRLIIHISAK